MATGKATVKAVYTLAEAFVASQKGQWGHDAWEKLLRDAALRGVVVDDDEARRNLGSVVEGGRYFYHAAESERGKAGKSR